MQPNGNISWAFSASGPILAAPVVDAETSPISIYVADAGGRVYKVGNDGRPDYDFVFVPVGLIRSSPALAGNHLYLGSDDGNLYAIDKHSGQVDWAFLTGNAIVSSPAVATNGTEPPVVIV